MSTLERKACTRKAEEMCECGRSIISNFKVRKLVHREHNSIVEEECSITSESEDEEDAMPPQPKKPTAFYSQTTVPGRRRPYSQSRNVIPYIEETAQDQNLGQTVCTGIYIKQSSESLFFT